MLASLSSLTWVAGKYVIRYDNRRLTETRSIMPNTLYNLKTEANAYQQISDTFNKINGCVRYALVSALSSAGYAGSAGSLRSIFHVITHQKTSLIKEAPE